MSIRGFAIVRLIAVASILVLVAAGAAEAKKDYLARFSGKAMSLAAAGMGSTTVEIGITRWTTDQERDQLLGVLTQEGSKGLSKALEDQPDHGYIRTNNTGTRTLRYARDSMVEGRRRIVVATDRLMTAYESVNPTRSEEYTMSVAVLSLDADNTGDGQIYPAMELSVDELTKTLAAKNFTAQPIRLVDLHPRK